MDCTRHGDRVQSVFFFPLELLVWLKKKQKKITHTHKEANQEIVLLIVPINFFSGTQTATELFFLRRAVSCGQFASGAGHERVWVPKSGYGLGVCSWRRQQHSLRVSNPGAQLPTRERTKCRRPSRLHRADDRRRPRPRRRCRSDMVAALTWHIWQDTLAGQSTSRKSLIGAAPTAKDESCSHSQSSHSASQSSHVPRSAPRTPDGPSRMEVAQRPFDSATANV